MERWALREGVRQVQKSCGKALYWCDAARLDDFDEADAEFWLRWVTDLNVIGATVTAIVDRLMGKTT